ncbi:MAG: aminotransferase class V-fold PLP-dependent enzyme [Pseudomonadota bacterium]
MTRVYLDYNATTPMGAEARAAMIRAMDLLGNPSSVHAEGRAAKAMVEEARTQVARLVDCLPAEVVFTSGATEAAQILSAGLPDRTFFVEPTAHDALLSQSADLSKQVTDTLAMGLANSETGIINLIPTKSGGGWHVGDRSATWLLLDITQAAGRIPFSFQESGAEFALLSAHKLGGPKGIGALIVKQGVEIPALAKGGGQEMGRRSGTENVIGIAGFGAAAAAAETGLRKDRWKEVDGFRKILENALAAEAMTTIFVGKDVPRLPNTSCFATPGWKSETQVMQMDLAGFAISAGAACSSGKVRPSTVLLAMGYDEAVASSAIRVSLGLETTEEEVRRFAAAWLEKERKFRARAA